MKRLVLGINVETFDGKVPDRKGTWKSTQEFQKLSEEKLGFSSVSFRRNATEAEVRTDFQCLKEQLCEDYGSDRFVNLDLLDSNTDPRPETDMVMIFVSSHAPGPNYQGCIVLWRSRKSFKPHSYHQRFKRSTSRRYRNRFMTPVKLMSQSSTYSANSFLLETAWIKSLERADYPKYLLLFSLK